MKKFISIFLCMLMFLSAIIPGTFALASNEVYEKTPMIYIRGNGATMYTEDGEEILTGFDVFTDDSEDGSFTKEQIVETAVNILLPFLTGGMLNDEWEAYGDALYEELAPLWEKVTLDGDGNAKYGIGVSRSELNWSENVRANQDTGTDGWYSLYDYSFVYDWRLSPYDNVDRLHTFIQKIMAATKSQKVCISAKCMGGSLLNAYIEKYGSLGHIKKIFYSDVLSNGCAFISNTFSGKIELNDKVLQTYLKQMEYLGEYDIGGVAFVMSDTIWEIVNRTMDLITQTGVADTIFGGTENLYNRLYQEFIPALCLAAGFATYPNYWASVYEKDFDRALNLIFGKEGSESRKENAGLIEKIQLYRNNISSNLPAFYEKIKSYGIEVGILAKYGYVDAPFTSNSDDLSDALVALRDASFGATTAPIFTTLSDEYIQSRIDLGYGKHISPDKMVDTSTCVFPETTWIIKNAHHNDGDCFDYIAEYFFRYSNVTVNSNSLNVGRFSVLDHSAPGTMAPMTEENMSGFDWMNTAEQKPTVQTRLMSFFKWLTTIFNFITKLLKGEISLGK